MGSVGHAVVCSFRGRQHQPSLRRPATVAVLVSFVDVRARSASSHGVAGEYCLTLAHRPERRIPDLKRVCLAALEASLDGEVSLLIEDTLGSSLRDDGPTPSPASDRADGLNAAGEPSSPDAKPLAMAGRADLLIQPVSTVLNCVPRVSLLNDIRITRMIATEPATRAIASP